MTVGKKIVLWGGGAVVLVGALVLIFLAWLALAPSPTAFATGERVTLASYHGPSPTGVPASLASADLVARGEYLTRAADCAACHTAKGGTPFAGGRPFKLPFGTLYAPNITPDKATGIGQWSDADFLKAVHKGVARDGQRLYPAFPYASYSLMADNDVLAIKAYLFSLKPVHQAAPENTLVFPFNQRPLMAIWGLMFNRDQRFEPVVGQSPEWNRGAYLVEGAGHCAECHSPRNLMQAVDNRRKFAGGVADGWNAYNISSDRLTGIGAWSQTEVEAYLHDAHSAGRGSASGPMAEVVDLSLRHLAPGDIHAMAVYLRSVPAIHSKALPDTLAGPAPISHRELVTDNAGGKKIFEGACVSCHAWSGAGTLTPRAQLTGARAVNDPSAVNVAQMILSGTGPVASGRPYMPGFGASYTDREIAETANYVTARFGSAPSKVTPAQVAKLRAAQ